MCVDIIRFRLALQGFSSLLSLWMTQLLLFKDACWFCCSEKKVWHRTPEVRDKYKTDSKKSKQFIKGQCSFSKFSDQHSHSLALGLHRSACVLPHDRCRPSLLRMRMRIWARGMKENCLRGLISNSYTWTMAAKVRKGGSCVRKRLCTEHLRLGLLIPYTTDWNRHV